MDLVDSEIPTSHGFDTSTYTQIARMVLTEMGVRHNYIPTAGWVGDARNCDYHDLNPFGLPPDESAVQSQMQYLTLNEPLMS